MYTVCQSIENHKEHLKYSGKMKKGNRESCKELQQVKKSISHAKPKEKSLGLNTY